MAKNQTNQTPVPNTQNKQMDKSHIFVAVLSAAAASFGTYMFTHRSSGSNTKKNKQLVDPDLKLLPIEKRVTEVYNRNRDQFLTTYRDRWIKLGVSDEGSSMVVAVGDSLEELAIAIEQRLEDMQKKGEPINSVYLNTWAFHVGHEDELPSSEVLVVVY